MSPRRPDPTTRAALIETAARLLSEEGPRALSTRRVATETGCSTMAVYTHFGSMNDLVREIAREGFARLETYLTSLDTTDDPVADMAVLGRLYRHNAMTNAHLYEVMFGGSSLSGFQLTDEDRQYGRYTLANVVHCAQRCIAAGRFPAGDAELVAHQMWTTVHGIASLELGRYLVEPCTGDRLFESQLVGLMVSVGDEGGAAAGSVEVSAKRFAELVGAENSGCASARAPSIALRARPQSPPATAGRCPQDGLDLADASAKFSPSGD
ncbi:TetR/AcrR family transcriptional regulator [Streptomyces boluensis]|uniref:TetR family transcriptional regulator n=1 Tax=Streptomyces boluensis TaxID=1775135 RepID=A0A964UR61_9ACTN|nr:TetR/AcrR family transcriptional regulator [Streptomyces boluensis]NBE53771.1 TetR family transcriptional regulator [Streptomyces boluensis]